MDSRGHFLVYPCTQCVWFFKLMSCGFCAYKNVGCNLLLRWWFGCQVEEGIMDGMLWRILCGFCRPLFKNWVKNSFIFIFFSDFTHSMLSLYAAQLVDHCSWKVSAASSSVQNCLLCSGHNWRTCRHFLTFYPPRQTLAEIFFLTFLRSLNCSHLRNDQS